MDEFRTNEVQLQVLAHALAEGLLLFDLNGVLQYLNPEAERLLGWNRAEALGLRTHIDLHDPAQNHEEMCFFERALASQTIVRAEAEKVFRQDGSAFFALAVASPVEENGCVVGCAVALWDISESIHLSEDRRQLRLQNTALNATLHAIVKMDHAGKILWANPAFTHLTGYALENVLGQTLRFLRSGYQDQEFYERMWKTIFGRSNLARRAGQPSQGWNTIQ